MKDCPICRWQHEDNIDYCPVCEQLKDPSHTEQEKTVPPCILCGKPASHYYDQKDHLQVYAVPYEMQFAFMKFKFPMCMNCDLSYKYNRDEYWKKIHSIASEKAAHYWSGWMSDNGFYGNEDDEDYDEQEHIDNLIKHASELKKK